MRAFVDGDVDGLEYEIQRVNALIKHDLSLIIIPAHDLKSYPQKAIYPNAVSNLIELRIQANSIVRSLTRLTLWNYLGCTGSQYRTLDRAT